MYLLSLWSLIEQGFMLQGAQDEFVAKAQLVVQEADGWIFSFDIYAAQNWQHRSCYYHRFIDPRDGAQSDDVIVIDLQQCAEQAALLDCDIRAVYVAVLCHEIAHGLINRLLPARENRDIRSTLGEYPDEDMAWEVAWALFNQLPKNFQALCSSVAWVSNRAFCLGTYWATQSASGYNRRLPPELRESMLQRIASLWAMGIDML